MTTSDRIAESVGRAVLAPPEEDVDREDVLTEVREIYGEVKRLEFELSTRKGVQGRNAELNRIRLGQENELAELREELAEVTGHRDSLISNIGESESNKQELNAEIARLKSQPESGQCETCEGTGKVETCAEYEFPGTPEKDCPDCSVKPESGQWAVTISGMDEKRAHQLIRYIKDWPHNADKHYAVPLHAPAEDGPWVVMVHVDGCRYPSFWTGQQDYYTGLTEDANQFAGYSVAQHAAREYTRKYDSLAWPVRLEDVEWESGKPDA